MPCHSVTRGARCAGDGRNQEPKAIQEEELNQVKLHNRKNAGFTLIELMIVVAIIAVIASVAIPKLLSARLSANESAAISTLRSISSAQAQLQSSVSIDVDQDGAGEYGYFAELAGTIALRETDGAGGTQVGADLLAPAMLSSALGLVNNSVVTRSGYCFQIWLPDAAAAPLGQAEAAGGGYDVANTVDPDNSEVFWACYAWPLDFQGTGNRVFFINQDGDILQYNNKGVNVYETDAAGPAFSAAYRTADMSDQIANSAAGFDGFDGETWTVVQ